MRKRDYIRFTEDQNDQNASDLESLYAADEDYIVDADWPGGTVRTYIRNDYLDLVKTDIITELALARIRERADEAARVASDRSKESPTA